MSERTADEAAIRQLFAATITAWDEADAEAFGAAFTEDADYVIFVGTHYRGRAAIIAMHDVLWRRFLKGSRLLGHVTGIRFITDDVAVLTSVGRVLKSRFSRRNPDKAQTFVAVRQGGEWKFTAFHNCRRRPLLERISTRTDPRLAPNTPPIPATLSA